MALLDLMRPMEYSIARCSYRKYNSNQRDAIDHYVSARYGEIMNLTAEIDSLKPDKNANEIMKKMERARHLVRDLTEAIRYFKMYDKLFSEESPELKEAIVSSVEYSIAICSYMKNNSNPRDAIDHYISARYEEIEKLAAKIGRLKPGKRADKIMERAKHLVEDITETIRYLNMYEKLFPEESPKLKEEAIPDVITDMIIFEVEETLEDSVEFAMN
ncbi:hypothetical protein KY343_01080 [Candidatus Woesearchaeota archaeon]|nr:hypothetical protein [Candidatus Woesearchaeota archaeon]